MGYFRTISPATTVPCDHTVAHYYKVIYIGTNSPKPTLPCTYTVAVIITAYYGDGNMRQNEADNCS